MSSDLPAILTVITRVLIGSTSTVLFPLSPSSAYIFVDRKGGCYPLCESSAPANRAPRVQSAHSPYPFYSIDVEKINTSTEHILSRRCAFKTYLLPPAWPSPTNRRRTAVHRLLSLYCWFRALPFLREWYAVQIDNSNLSYAEYKVNTQAKGDPGRWCASSVTGDPSASCLFPVNPALLGRPLARAFQLIMTVAAFVAVRERFSTGETVAHQVGKQVIHPADPGQHAPCA